MPPGRSCHGSCIVYTLWRATAPSATGARDLNRQVARHNSMASSQFAYIWQYQIRPDCRSDFLKAYSPSGDWAELFSRDPSYLGTKLLQDAEDENGYATIDYWRSRSDRDSFRERFSAEYNELDRRCEEFTVNEHFVGDYVEIDDTAA